MRKELILVTIAALALITGCGGEKTVKEPPPAASSQEGASTEGVEQGGVESGGNQGATTQQQQLLAQRIIYFDFDTADIRPEFTDLIAAHARNLASNQRLKVRLEGHTDERGTREYNIGLGERRAQSVRRALMLQGVGDGQIVTVSYGEERPAVSGTDEAAWAKNRRVELVYGN